MSSFKRYIHVERLDSDECAGLLENNGIYVTAKVDGSNGSVWWDGDAHRAITYLTSMRTTRGSAPGARRLARSAIA